jgi:cytochrome c5
MRANANIANRARLRGFVAAMVIATASVVLAVAVAAGSSPQATAAQPQPAKPSASTTSAKPVARSGKAEVDPMRSAIVRPAEAAELAALPEGPTKTLVAQRCLMCHGAGLITQQHKDAAAWGRTVTQMRTWGSPIQDEDQAAIVAYLAEHFGPAAKH